MNKKYIIACTMITIIGLIGVRKIESGFFKDVKKGFEKAGKGVKSGFEKAGKGIKSAAESAADLGEDLSKKGIKLSKKTIDEIRDAGQDAIKQIKKAVDKVHDCALVVSKGSEYAARKATYESAKIAEQSISSAVEQTNKVSNAIGKMAKVGDKTFNIKRVGFAIDSKKIPKGSIVENVNIELNVAGKTVKISNLDLNISKGIEAIPDLAEKIAKRVFEEVKDSFSIE